ncbi:MAG TPA: trigger factor, partial [Thermoclostridium caenicola]|uniref:trigger factor n=1 Tax=Thermoclostridium caenicola TaxID=659425 RepID=UPI002C6B22DF|nr:trigger factor [Thermoclostridium caenicola]HOK43688.1 trigger factor [Thermoclostridium caenicola]HOL84848.1 trigger factor [Thermoclostridium caenicola]HPO76468.1 trigger factor [Thermoclostridium caenicola]
MNVKIEKPEKNVVKLEITVDSQVFDECMDKAFMRNKSRFNVPGFRKGKAPRSLVERYYGEQVLYEDAINFAAGDAYNKAIDEHDLEPVDRPEIDIIQIGSGKDFIFTATVTVKPEVELGQYKGLEVQKEEVKVTEEDVNAELNRIAERNAKLVSVEDRPVQSGDMVNIDYEGSIDGVAFEGGSAKGYNLVIGSNTFIPGFEDQLIGFNLNDEKDIQVKFPEDYHNKDLAGKDATFRVKVNEIKVKQLPEINDEFAGDVSEFDTLEEFRQDLMKKLTRKAQEAADRKFENAVVAKAAENASCDIPDVMVESRLNEMMRQFDMTLRYQGLDLPSYLQIMGMDAEKFRDEYRESALKDVKAQLVLEKIAKTEGIEATDEEYAQELEKMAEQYRQPVEEMKKHLHEDDIEYIKNSIITRKTVAMLVENAKA